MATVKKELSDVNKCINEVKEELDAKNKPELGIQKDMVQVKKEIVKKEEEKKNKDHVALATIANNAMILTPGCSCIGGSGAPSSSQGSKRYLPGPKGTHPKGFPLKCLPATCSAPKFTPPKCLPVKGPPSKPPPLAHAPPAHRKQ